MKAWLLDALEGLPRLRQGSIDSPQAGPDEVLLKVRYAALNPADRHLAEGRYPAKPTLPHILGRDGAGHTDSGIQAILRSEIGVGRPGTFAEFVAVPKESLVNISNGWTEEQMAGVPLVYLTAYQALTQWSDLPPTAVVLITGASGGVGVASVQLAEALGHTVIALSRSADKRQRLKELGADFVIDPADRSWVDNVKRSIAPRRVDLAVDNIAGPLFPEVIATLADRGRISVVGREAGTVPDFNTGTLFFKRLRIGGVAVGAYTAMESQSAWQSVVKLMDSKGFRPVVDSIFDFDQLPEAFERLKQGPMGKVLLRVGIG